MLKDKTIFSKNSELFCHINKQTIKIFNLQDNKIINIIDIEEKISYISFDNSSKYIIIGTTNGNLYQYLYNSNILYSKLYTFKQNSTVEFLAFYNDSLACSSNSGEIIIINLMTQMVKKEIHNTNHKITSLYFINYNKLISTTIDGTLFLNYIDDSKPTRKLNLGLYGIKQILSINSNFSFIISSYHLSLVDLKKLKIKNIKYLSFKSRILDITIISKSTFLIYLENKKTEILKLASTESLKKNLFTNKLYLNIKLLEKYPMLTYSKEAILTEDSYNEQLDLASTALVNQQQKLALNYLKPFQNLDSKKDEISSLFLAFEQYGRFQELFIEQKYKLCYLMAQRYKPLKKTTEYEKLERIFTNSYLKAQKYMLNNKKDLAYETINPFITLEDKRDFIKSILYHNDNFILFLQYIQNFEHKKIEILLEKNHIFKNIPAYSSYKLTLEDLILKLERYLEVGDIESFQNEFIKLKESLHFKKEIQTLELKYITISEFLLSYENNDFKHSFLLLDSFNYLHSLEIAQLLESHWKKIIIKCELYALDGDIYKIKKQLGEFLFIPTRRKIVTALIQLATYTKITTLLTQRKYVECENLIYLYLDMFSYTTEIKSLIQQFEQLSKTKLAITQDINLTISPVVSAKGF